MAPSMIELQGSRGISAAGGVAYRPTADPQGRLVRLLAISSELPWPLDSGGHLRTFHLLRAFARQFDVRLIAAMEPNEADSVGRLQREGINVQAVVVRPRRVWREIPRVLGAAVRREPYVLYRRHDRRHCVAIVQQEISRETRTWCISIISILSSFDRCSRTCH